MKFATVLKPHEKKAGCQNAGLANLHPTLTTQFSYISAVGPGPQWLMAQTIWHAIYTEFGNCLRFGSLGSPFPHSLRVIIGITMPTSTGLSQVTHSACSSSPFPSECRAFRCLETTVNQCTLLTKATYMITTLLSAEVIKGRPYRLEPEVSFGSRHGGKLWIHRK